MSKAAVLQMVSTASIEINLATVEQMLAQANEQDVSLAVLPENFACMGQENDKFLIAEIMGEGAIQSELSRLSKRYNIWLIAGTIPIKTKGKRVRSASLVYDNQGICVARYDKIHLFDVEVSDKERHQESFSIEPGNELVIVDTPVGKIGLTVCYDLRFPELFQKLLQKGTTIFSVPSAFTAITGAAHWEVLLRARAIETQCYILASNQGGSHVNGRHTYGHSMIVDPWGKILSYQEQGNAMITAKIDLPMLMNLRKRFPCNEHHVL